MPKKRKIEVENLSRLMVYVLGHRPDEFGLVPDPHGFITYKELLWAIHEEPGWSYVRQGHINEVLLGKERSLFQPEDNRIRILDRRWHINLDHPCQSLPKILFIAVRRKAHPFVMEKGLIAPTGKYLVLSSDRDMAMRIGRRRDQRPVLLEIMASGAQEKGALFYTFGQLFLTSEVPSRFISGPPASPETDSRGQLQAGPPLAKEIGKAPRGEARVKRDALSDFQAGTFVLDIHRDPDPSRRAKGRKRKGWKEEARKLRKRRPK